MEKARGWNRGGLRAGLNAAHVSCQNEAGRGAGGCCKQVQLLGGGQTPGAGMRWCARTSPCAWGAGGEQQLGRQLQPVLQAGGCEHPEELGTAGFGT